MERPSPDLSTQALFQQEWQTYRKVLDHDYFCHRAVGNCLRQILQDEAVQPFSFLDIGCGDASGTLPALRGAPVARYFGIDLSAAALDLARAELAVLGCPVSLTQHDFVAALRDWSSPLDVVWIGLCLHHLDTPAKGEVMRTIRGVLRKGGLLLIYEDTSPDGEDRAGWLRRWDAMRSMWPAFTDDEWAAITAHVHAADFPETVSSWQALGANAGFASVREVYRMPADLFRMYVFSG